MIQIVTFQNNYNFPLSTDLDFAFRRITGRIRKVVELKSIILQFVAKV